MRSLGMWIDTYGNEDPPEVSLNIYFFGQAHHSEPVRVSDETRELRWFSSENLPCGCPSFRPRRRGDSLPVSGIEGTA